MKQSNKTLLIVGVIIAAAYWYKKNQPGQAMATVAENFTADDFGRPATIDGETGILV